MSGRPARFAFTSAPDKVTVHITLQPFSSDMVAQNDLLLQFLETLGNDMWKYVSVDHGHQKSSGRSDVSISFKPLAGKTSFKDAPPVSVDARLPEQPDFAMAPSLDQCTQRSARRTWVAPRAPTPTPAACAKDDIQDSEDVSSQSYNDEYSNPGVDADVNLIVEHGLHAQMVCCSVTDTLGSVFDQGCALYSLDAFSTGLVIDGAVDHGYDPDQTLQAIGLQTGTTLRLEICQATDADDCFDDG